MTNYPTELDDIIAIYKKIKEFLDENKISEIDTQVILIEPVLSLAGWDIFDPATFKRTNRDTKNPMFDIELHNKGKLRIAIECKSLKSDEKSDEFNIKKLKGKSQVGRLKLKNKKAGTDPKWYNIGKDGVGQLRAYCKNYKHFQSDTTAVLTNGYEWVIFDNTEYLKEENLKKRIKENCIKGQSALNEPDFEGKIIKLLKNPIESLKVDSTE